MKQPEVWARHAQPVIATGRRPHFAPSEEVLAIQRSRVADFVARNGTGCLAVILGATPELADIALAAGCRVVRVDCNPAMFEAATRRQRVADRRNETCVIGDWLHLETIRAGAADIVLGDSSLNNVPHEQMQGQIAELERITRPGSQLLLRQIVIPDEPRPDYEFDRAVAAYRAGDVTANEFHWMLRFHSFVANAYDPASRVLDACRIFVEIEARHAQGRLSAAEFEFLMSRYTEVRHTVYRRAEQVRLLQALGDCEVVPPGAAGCTRDLFGVFVVTRVAR